MSHTPGPWTAEESGNQNADGSSNWGVFAKDRSEYASSDEKVVLADYLRRDDALLIASAPLLLAAAKKAADFVASISHQHDVEPIWRPLDEAIRKAEGQS